MNFEQFVSDIKLNNLTVYGVEVYKDGKLVHSFGDTEDGIYDIYSATKSIVSIAVGIAYDRGLIDFSESILKYLPNDKISMISQKQRDMFEKITVERLLTMSVVGFPFRPEGENYLDFSLNVEIKNPEEKLFAYSNIPVYLICVALQQVLNEDLGDFIVKNILEPLEISKYEYERSPEGIFYGASKMKMTVNELSRIGILMMNMGVYNGKRIISEKYVKLATSVMQNNSQGGYGYYFWKYRDGYSINGKWEQKCYCLPSENLIITYLAHIEDEKCNLLKSMEKYIIFDYI